MRLIMSARLAWSANYCNEEGQVLFRSESPGVGASGHDIKVLRVVPPCIDGVVGDAELQDFYENVGEVNYRVRTSSSIVYQGVCHPTNTFFRKGGLSSSCRRDRIFRGPDGNEYIWKLTIKASKLFLNDSSNTPIAKFHDKLSLHSERNPADLEIFSAGRHMVEWILLTFIYVEKLRGDREARNKSHYQTKLEVK